MPFDAYFRTRFGYHIVKVVDKRVNRGEVSVAHIMILKQGEAAQQEKALATINDIYKKIQQGESFESLAQELILKLNNDQRIIFDYSNNNLSSKCIFIDASGTTFSYNASIYNFSSPRKNIVSMARNGIASVLSTSHKLFRYLLIWKLHKIRNLRNEFE